MHLPLGQNKAWAIKCPAHTAGIPCRKMPNAATDVIGDAAQLKQRKAKRATPSQLYLVSFPAWDIFTRDTSLLDFLWMFGAIPVGLFVLLAAFASAGWGLGLFFFYLFAVMLHAYAVDDRVVPPREDEGEEY